jgi:hypothetical protein
MNSVGVILKSTTNNGGLPLCRRAYNGDNDDYHKRIVGGAVQAQSMTTVIEGNAVKCTQEVDGGAY